MIKGCCPACGEEGVRPVGDADSSILIVGEVPTESDMKSGKPFSSAQTGRWQSNQVSPSQILKRELATAGLEIVDCRLMMMYIHPTEDENCMKAGIDTVIAEAQNKRAILLVGADTVSTFTAYKVSEVCGLSLDSEMLPADLIVGIPNPAVAYAKGAGELRLAIKKFVDKVNEMGLIKEEEWK